jgi:DNA-binding MarR family transcriptional regulator
LEGISSTQKFVLISLADQANDSGVCWPSMSSIAKRTCLSAKAVRQAIKQLEELGVLRIERTKHESRDQWTSNRYYLTPEKYKQVPTVGEYLPTVSTNPDSVGTNPRLVGYLPTVGGVPTDVPINRNRTVNEPSENQSLSSGDDNKKPDGGTQKQKADRIPYDEIFDLYNEIVATPFGRPLVRVRNDKRKRLIKKIWEIGTETKTLDWWRKYFALATQNEGWMNGRQYKDGFWEGANFDFLLREDNFLKIVE